MQWMAMDCGGITAPAAILFAGAVAIVAAGYVVASRQNIDGTTKRRRSSCSRRVSGLVEALVSVSSAVGGLLLALAVAGLLVRFFIGGTRFGFE
jgi:hypothetical protein